VAALEEKIEYSYVRLADYLQDFNPLPQISLEKAEKAESRVD
jgi:hypothetical protein